MWRIQAMAALGGKSQECRVSRKRAESNKSTSEECRRGKADEETL